MTYSDYIQTITNSLPTDWKYDDERTSYLYLPDISIMMCEKQAEKHTFEESWTENYCKSNAYTHVIELYYNGMRIDDFYTAIVDGNRMCIPYPKRDGMTITREQYGIGRIVNIPYCSNDIYSFDEYLCQAGITVEM